MGRHIVLLSGGLSSAYVACTLEVKDKILLFTDTKWEHPDLYRFLDDIERYTGITITRLVDGRTPEDVFYDVGFLGNNRVPVCSRVLKAQMTQKFIRPGDFLYFGITHTEAHRSVRIRNVYDSFGVICVFPLISSPKKKSDIIDFFKRAGIEIPEMYKKGFQHNNCYGGCVRQGVAGWLHLLKTYPEIYMDRERIEIEFSEINTPATFMKDCSLREFREKYMNQAETLELFQSEDLYKLDSTQQEDFSGECIGVCNHEN